MRIPLQSRTADVGINMTPMIDVVFQLIIFFLVTSHFARQELQMKLPLPAAESGLAEKNPEKPRLVINVTSDGAIYFTGRQVTPQELQARLAERLGDLGQDVEVRIRGDRGVAYRHVEPIMLSCARAGIWNITYAVYRKEDVP